MNYGILKGKEVVPACNVVEWAEEFEQADRTVSRDVLPSGTRVSTVFLGIDHSFGYKMPQWFETMIFGGPEDGYVDRYESWDKAVKGHARAVEIARKAESKPYKMSGRTR